MFVLNTAYSNNTVTKIYLAKNKIYFIFVTFWVDSMEFFIYKYLSGIYGNDCLKTIIDEANRFICISIKVNEC